MSLIILLYPIKLHVLLPALTKPLLIKSMVSWL